MILTEEELTLNEKILNNSVRAKAMYETDHNLIEDIIASHRSLLSANAELSFEIMMRKRYEGFLKVVARSGEELEDHQDFEWFKVRTAIFSKKEELK